MRPLPCGEGIAPHFGHVKTAIGIPGQRNRADDVGLGGDQLDREIRIGEAKRLLLLGRRSAFRTRSRAGNGR